MTHPYLTPAQLGTGSVSTVCASCGHGKEQPAPEDCRRPERHRKEKPVVGMCTACGAVEVWLNRASGTRDLSNIGESAAYPTGYGCEACA